MSIFRYITYCVLYYSINSYICLKCKLFLKRNEGNFVSAEYCLKYITYN